MDQDPKAQPPQTTTNGDPASTNDARPGPQFTQADPPATRQNVGTVPGWNQPKPYSVK